MPRLLAEIKDTYDGRRAATPTSSSSAPVEVDLLHLDDLGAEKRTEWVLEQLYSIVNERWQEERSIVVTTNLADVDELREQIGERTVSRLDRDLRRADPDHGPRPAGSRRIAPSARAAPRLEPACRD